MPCHQIVSDLINFIYTYHTKAIENLTRNVAFLGTRFATYLI